MVFMLDFVTKRLLEGQDGVLIDGVIGISTHYNTGAAMSLFSGSAGVMGFLSMLGAAGLVYVAWRFAKGKAAMIALGMIFGGAVGNGADRIAYGHVIDLFETLFIRFWIFNVADAAITIGCVICAYLLLFRYRQNWKGSGADDA